MGLFGKKKEDKDTSSSGNNNNNTQPAKRPPPSPNGLNGISNSSSSLQNGMPFSSNNGQNGGYNSGYASDSYSNGGPRSPMSPSFPHQQNNSIVGGAGPQSPMSGPPSPMHPQNNGFGGQQQPPAGSAAAAAGLLATPQLFWAQRRILGTNPFPRFQHTSSIIANGTDIFLYGGTQRGIPKGDLFVIDSTSLQCQAIAAAGADAPMPKSGHSAVSIGQYILYFGGWDSMSGQCDDTLHVLHTARKEWNKPPLQGPLPTPRHSHSGCSVGTTMYIFGGQVDNFYLDDIAAFDMKSITQNPRWEKLEPQTESPPGRSGHCAGVHDGKIYIFGGADADYFYNDIWCFDPRALTWTPIPASGYLPTGRHGHACTVTDGVMYIFGGNSPDGTELNDAYAFKIHERRWYLFQSVGPVASPRSGHTMCTIKDRVFILGGESELTKQEDSALIHVLELSKIRYPDMGPQVIPQRQASSQKPGALSIGQQLADAPASAGPPERPDRPDRPDRRHTQRPSSPATFVDRQGSLNNLSISQQTSQLMNPQLGQRPLTTFGTPPPRGASAGFQNAGVGGGTQTTNYQAEGLSIATRRQTLKDDFQGGYGGAVIGTANVLNSPNGNRRTMHQMPMTPTSGESSPSPLRVINVSPSSPPSSGRSLPGNSSDNNINSHALNHDDNVPIEEEINPYAMEAITSHAPAPLNIAPPSTSAVGPSYIPPPPGAASGVGPVSPVTPPQPSANFMRSNLPPPPSTPSPPVSGAINIPAAAEKRPGQILPPPSQHQLPQPPSATLSPGGSTPIPGVIENRSSSPGPGRFVARGSGGSTFGLGIGPAPSSPIPTTAGGSGDLTARTSASDMAKIKSLESRAEEAQDENELLKQEIEKMKKRENWLVTEVILARETLISTGGKKDHSENGSSMQAKRMSMIELEQQLDNVQLEGQQLKITKALIRVKEELKTTKMAIATQAQSASMKIKEAERIRTGALQEAAYLKAKISSMSNAQQDPDALARIEMERAADLEKRLTSALNELEALESQYAKVQETMELEKAFRLSAEERSNGSALLAEQAQAAHTRALSELSTLHNRAAKAESESREYAAELAEVQAGFSGHQSQSSGLLQKVTSLKQQVEQHEKALERTQMAYSAANERALRAETQSEVASSKVEKLESVRFQLSSDVNRYKSEAERLHSKVEELETKCQVSKDELITLRKLVEDGLGAFNPRGNQRSAERKHDSIAILSTVSRVSELEHELGSLKRLHAASQNSASKSASELADNMMELSRLEQTSMQARAETISLQKMLSQEREASAELRSELTRAEFELESKVKELEAHEVQLGLLKNVMQEKGIIAEDVVNHARARGTGEYAASLEEKVREAEERIETLEQDLVDSRDYHTQQLQTFESQRQATIQHSEKTGMLLRKLKDDLAATMREKDEVEQELSQLQQEHAHCHEKAMSLSNSQKGQKAQDDERVQMLQMHWDEERRELTHKANDVQNRLMEAEMLAAELSQKVISITERLEEIEGLNESLSEELESMQDQAESIKVKATQQEAQLKADVERLVGEIHQIQEKLHTKQQELEEAVEMNDQLETQLDRAVQAQAAAVAASANHSGSSQEAQRKLEQQRQDLEQRLKKAQETIQVLEGDNSVLEARLSDSEKKVALLLEDMQSNVSHPNSPFNSANLTNNLASVLSVQQQQQQQKQKLQQLATPISVASPVTSAYRLAAGSVTKNHSVSSSPIRATSSSPLKKAPAANQGYTSYDHDYEDATFSQQQHHHQQQLHADEDSDDDVQYGQAAYNHYGNPKGQQQQQQGQGEMSSRRDSVDSITRELELLKVPWNSTKPATSLRGLGGAASATSSLSASPSSSLPPPPQQQLPQRQSPVSPLSQNYHQQQQQQQSYAYDQDVHGNNSNNQYYGYGEDEDDSSDGDNEEEYLNHLRQQQHQQQQQQHQKQKQQPPPPHDTHSFNDRSPSRLKEYEQMIDEIENARMH